MGKQAKPTTEKTQTQPPAFVSAAQQSMLGSIQGTLGPYMLGNNFNPDQMRAFEMTRQEAENPTQLPFVSMERTPIDRVDPSVPGVMSPAYLPATFGNAASTGAASAGSVQLDPAAWAKFYSPFQQNVIDTTLAQSRNELGKDLNAVRARAAAGSAYGGSGSRAALQEGQLRSDYDRNSAAVIAQLQAQGFTEAQARAMANTELQQQTALANAGFQQQANLANSGYQQQTNMANAGYEQQMRLTNAANNMQAQALNTANQQATGATNQDVALRRALAQAGFDQTTNQFNAGGQNTMALTNAGLRSQALQNLLGIGNAQYGYPLQAAQIMAAAIPKDYGGTSITEKSAPQGPSMLQQLLGVGLSIAGAPMSGGTSLIGGLGSLFGGSKG